MISIVLIKKENFCRFQNELLEIEQSSFQSPWSLNAFKGELNNPISNLWALAVEGRISGYVCYWAFSHEIHIMNIAIHPQERRKGYGRQLLTRVIELGRSQSLGIVWLEVRASNSAARAFYSTAGFCEVGRRPGYYCDNGEDAIIMSLNLSCQM